MLNFWGLFFSALVSLELLIFHLVPPFAALITFLVTRKDEWYNRLWLREFKGEQKFFSAIRLKKWKDRAATWNTGLFAAKDISQLRLAINMTQSEIVHELIFLLSFLPLLLARQFSHLPLLAVLCAAFAVANLPFVFIQRYNRPRVMKSRRLCKQNRK